MRKAAASLALPVLVSLGCATTGDAFANGAPTLRRTLNVATASFELTYISEDEGAIDSVVQALELAAPRVAVWGVLEKPIEVRVFPTHEQLEIAVGRRNYPWLRAWARYDEILLQSPRTFDLFERGSANLAELLTHELTHCLMYQRAAPRERWREVDRTIPIWFREGMASYTARQGHRRMSESRLAEWRERTGRDPLGEAKSLYQGSPKIAYGAAHWAFAFLVERYGAQAVRSILDAMRGGSPFPDAFSSVIGITAETFSNEYLRYLDWGGWIDRQRPNPDEVLVAEEAAGARPRPSTSCESGDRL